MWSSPPRDTAHGTYEVVAFPFCLHVIRGTYFYSLNPLLSCYLLKLFQPFLRSFSLFLLFFGVSFYLERFLFVAIYRAHLGLLSPYFMSAVRQNLAVRETRSEGVFFLQTHEHTGGRRFVTALAAFLCDRVPCRFSATPPPQSSVIFAHLMDSILCTYLNRNYYLCQNISLQW